MKNVKVQSPTGDMLVNQMRTGSLDAVVAYVSNADRARRRAGGDPHRHPVRPGAMQPFAVGRESRHKQLTRPAASTPCAPAESRERFEANGFTLEGRRTKRPMTAPPPHRTGRGPTGRSCCCWPSIGGLYVVPDRGDAASPTSSFTTPRDHLLARRC